MKFDDNMAGQSNSQSQVNDLFEKLISWRDESHKEISYIINSYNSHVKMGINNLVNEVSDLQDELSVIRKERNVLLETVENLSGEIRHLSAKIPSKKPSRDKELDHMQDIKQEEFSNTDIPEDIYTCEAVKRPEIPSEKNELVECSDYEAISEQNAEEPISKDDLSEDFICSYCNFAFSSNENLAIHEKNVHANPDLSEVSQEYDEESREPGDITNDEIVKSEHPEILHKSIENKNLHLHTREHTKVELEKRKNHVCEKCDKAFRKKSNLNTHIKAVHHKIKDHMCTECGYATSEKGALRKHMIVHDKIRKPKPNFIKHIIAVHDKIRDHICEECGYTASRKFNLTSHIKAVHDKIRDHICDQCDFTASEKAGLTKHIKAVHDKIRDHICKECGYAASLKADLKNHMKAVHDKIRNHICKECSFSTSRKDSLTMHIWSRHKNGQN